MRIIDKRNKSKQLIKRALERERGHSDNTTGVVMRWGRGETAHDTAKPVSCALAIS